MSAIAEKTLGDASRWEEIHALNPQITNPDLISPGQEIKIIGTLPAPQAAMSEQTPTVVPPRPKSPELDDRECQGTWQCAPQADNLSGQSAAPVQPPVIKSTANVLSQVTTAPPQKSGASKSPTEVLDAHIAQVQQTEAAQARAATLAKEQHQASETAFNVADAAVRAEAEAKQAAAAASAPRVQEPYRVTIYVDNGNLIEILNDGTTRVLGPAPPPQSEKGPVCVESTYAGTNQCVSPKDPKPGDVVSIGGTYNVPTPLLVTGPAIDVSFDKVYMADGTSDWFLTVGVGKYYGTPGATLKLNSGTTTATTKEQYKGFSTSWSADAAVVLGGGGSYSITPSGDTTVLGGLRISSPGASVTPTQGNWTFDIE